MASPFSSLSSDGELIVTPKIPQSWLVRTEAVDLANLEVRRMSPQPCPATTLRPTVCSWSLGKKSIDKKKTAGDEVATTLSNYEVELRAAMNGFELHSGLGQRCTRLVTEHKKSEHRI